MHQVMTSPDAPRVGDNVTRGAGLLHPWERHHQPKIRHRGTHHDGETCGYLCSGPPHSHRTATRPAHSPHCRECAGPVTSIWLQRAPEKRYPQVRDARHHAAPSKRIRLRVESGRASLPEAFGCIARQGPMLRIDSRRRTVNLTTRPTRCAWMRLAGCVRLYTVAEVRMAAPDVRAGQR